MTNIQLSVVAVALLLVVIDSYSFWGASVNQKNAVSSGFRVNSIRVNSVATQMSNSPYTSSTPSELFTHIMSDEEEEEEPEAPPTTTDAPAERSEVSSVKEGIMFPTTLNGTDVRVGIIMARWNNDIIAGLYKVIRLLPITVVVSLVF